MTKLAVRVQPGARRAEIRGWMEDGALRLTVTAPPEDGRANRAVIELLASALELKPRALSLARGGASRSKWIEIDGLEPAEVRRRIDGVLDRARRKSDGE
ncbi:MAG: DUF167 domain-containing protein [Candidatus Eisenbacteria bacterium]|nr:DUF167 domain-containing protein [Candidatus Eisenbacteria bacterium]